MVSLSKYYLIIVPIELPEFGTDMFIFHQENDTQQQCLDRLELDPDKYMMSVRINNFGGRLQEKVILCQR